MKKKNVLDDQHFVKLLDWFRANLADFRKRESTDPDIAEQATRELGFEVSQHNVRGVRVALGGIVLNSRQVPRPEVHKGQRADYECRERVNGLSQEAYYVRVLIENLYEALGERRPNVLDVFEATGNLPLKLEES